MPDTTAKPTFWGWMMSPTAMAIVGLVVGVASTYFGVPYAAPYLPGGKTEVAKVSTDPANLGEVHNLVLRAAADAAYCAREIEKVLVKCSPPAKAAPVQKAKQ